MSLAAFFACHLAGVLARLDALEQAMLRRRWVLEWEAERARLFARAEARASLYGVGIARDIREWRTER